MKPAKKCSPIYEAKQANLRDTLLRISGAIQVMEEILNEVEQPETAASTLEDGFVSPAEMPIEVS